EEGDHPEEEPHVQQVGEEGEPEIRRGMHPEHGPAQVEDRVAGAINRSPACDHSPAPDAAGGRQLRAQELDFAAELLHPACVGRILRVPPDWWPFPGICPGGARSRLAMSGCAAGGMW